MSSVTSPPTCVITGGSQGIGRACVEAFLARGYRVVTCARDATRLELLRSQLGNPEKLITIVSDVALAEGRQRLVDSVRSQFARLDALVHNAGAATLCPSHKMSDESFESLWRVNVTAVFGLTRELVPMLQLGDDSAIGFVSSMSAFDPYPGLGAYGACKAWVNHFAESLSVELQPLGIRTFAVCPGAVATPLLKRLFPEMPASEALAPEQVAEIIARLCQPPFQFTSGEVIRVRPRGEARVQ